MNRDQVVLITGSGRGLGRAFALAQSGAQVAVTVRPEIRAGPDQGYPELFLPGED